MIYDFSRFFGIELDVNAKFLMGNFSILIEPKNPKGIKEENVVLNTHYIIFHISL